LDTAYGEARKDDVGLKNGASNDSQEISVLDWRDAKSLVDSMRNPYSFAVLKLHGQIEKGESVILTTNHYRKVNANLAFRDLLKWMFTTNTCLFVGASLEDPDLVQLLNEAYTEYGDRFGPHYALLPSTEAPPFRIRILFENLRIQALPIETKVLSEENSSITHALAKVLKDICGEVALQQVDSGIPRFPSSNDRGFYLEGALGTLLEQVCQLTGSLRGDFCLPEGRPGTHIGGRLKYEVNRGPTKREVTNAFVNPNSICGIAYYKATSEIGVYLKNIDPPEFDAESGLCLYGEPEYFKGHDDVRSELAVPIWADGVRVGVLNIESRLDDAYSDGHRKVAMRFARKAGRLYAATNQLQKYGRRLDPRWVESAYDQLRNLFLEIKGMRKNNHPTDTSLAFLVYQVDYRKGVLRAQNPKTTVLKGSETNCDTPTFALGDDKALAVQVFSRGQPMIFSDAVRAIREGAFTGDFANKLGIGGAIAGLPVRIHGHIAGVVITWYCNGQPGYLDGRDVELFRRTAHLIANLGNRGEDTLVAGDELGPNVLRRFPSAELAQKIAGIFAGRRRNRQQRVSSDCDEYLDTLGRRWQAELSELIWGILDVLQKEEEKFRRGLSVRYQDGEPPKSWISPRRCRCWVRMKTVGDLHPPRFIAALQVSHSAEHPDKNLFEIRNVRPDVPEKVAVCSEPSPRFVNSVPLERNPRAGKARIAGRTLPRPERIRFNVRGVESEAYLFKENPHQSFLLSRIRADRFSRVQRPNVLGPDILADVLGKDRKRPWFIAPVVLGNESEWVQSEICPSTESHVLQTAVLSQEQRLVAYLTVDDGPPFAEPDMDEFSEERLGDEWASFQEDILHILDVFTACLAEHEGFRQLISEYLDMNLARFGQVA
jgi:hypothetical protein